MNNALFVFIYVHMPANKKTTQAQKIIYLLNLLAIIGAL